MSGCCAAASAPATESTSSVAITSSRFRHRHVALHASVHLALIIRTPSPPKFDEPAAGVVRRWLRGAEYHSRQRSWFALNEIFADKPASGVRGYHISVRISLRDKLHILAAAAKSHSENKGPTHSRPLILDVHL